MTLILVTNIYLVFIIVKVVKKAKDTLLIRWIIGILDCIRPIHL